jgi:succinate dehydrogenase/fumarate reductase-like Fe-S protein
MEKSVSIYIMGKRYEVPQGLTIMKALEHAGYRLVRGVGCRGGFCGACGTVYRTEGDYKIKVGLACQAVVEDGMHLTQIPFFPANKSVYDITEVEPTAEEILKEYPELYRCVACNTCTKSCPQDIEVMDYVQAALRGDIAKAADLSFDCIMCGLCAARCPAEIVQYHIGLLARRLYGRYVAPKAAHVQTRVAEMEEGKFDEEMKKLIDMDEEELKKLYVARTIEPN